MDCVRLAVGDFTFWISLSLSLFAQSEFWTERKKLSERLIQKVKSPNDYADGDNAGTVSSGAVSIAKVGGTNSGAKRPKLF